MSDLIFTAGNDIQLVAAAPIAVPPDSYTAQFVNGKIVLCSATTLGTTYAVDVDGNVTEKVYDLTVPAHEDYTGGTVTDFGLLSNGDCVYGFIYSKLSGTEPPYMFQMSVIRNGEFTSVGSPVNGNAGTSNSIYGKNENIVFAQQTYIPSGTTNKTTVIPIAGSGYNTPYVISSDGIMMYACGDQWVSSSGANTVDVTTMSSDGNVTFPYEGTLAAVLSGNANGCNAVTYDADYISYWLDAQKLTASKLVLPASIANTPYIYMASSNFGVVVGLDNSVYLVTAKSQKRARAVYPTHLLVPFPAACIPLCEDNS